MPSCCITCWGRCLWGSAPTRQRCTCFITALCITSIVHWKWIFLRTSQSCHPGLHLQDFPIAFGDVQMPFRQFSWYAQQRKRPYHSLRPMKRKDGLPVPIKCNIYPVIVLCTDKDSFQKSICQIVEFLHSDGLPRAMTNTWPLITIVERPGTSVTRGCYIPPETAAPSLRIDFQIVADHWYLQ